MEQLEQRLTAIEEKMIARRTSTASDEALFEARRALDRDLKPYRGKMTADQLAMLGKAVPGTALAGIREAPPVKPVLSLIP